MTDVARPLPVEAERPDHLARMLLGCSFAMQRLRAVVQKLGPTRLPVLIQGPTGAGKELVAQALHGVSGRRGPLVALNSAAFSDTMCEAEMFGYVRGAFSGAMRDHAGHLAEADGGTLLLDEVASMAPALQAKLLRALDSGGFRPVGARADRRSDFRLLAAANEDLDRCAEAGRFRPDLLHRLRGAVIHVPGLAQRVEDIPELVRHFARLEQRPGAAAVTFSESALCLLQERPWPGHVRELRHTIARVLACSPSLHVTAGELRDLLSFTEPLPETHAPSIEERRGELLALLTRAGHDTRRAAAILGVDRTTIYRRMRRLGITLPSAPRGGSEPRKMVAE